MTGEAEALVTYALLASILGYYSFSRILILLNLKREIRSKSGSDSEE
ncbi:MAG: hypothetical protein L7R66_00250 [Candidatus Thalassarchaeaceae archaeon]|nr:hypothetical protein [Candidatus Thalassarchaeaceae archaeon]